jgi:hypothetical protein
MGENDLFWAQDPSRRAPIHKSMDTPNCSRRMSWPDVLFGRAPKVYFVPGRQNNWRQRGFTVEGPCCARSGDAHPLNRVGQICLLDWCLSIGLWLSWRARCTCRFDGGGRWAIGRMIGGCPGRHGCVVRPRVDAAAKCRLFGFGSLGRLRVFLVAVTTQVLDMII